MREPIGMVRLALVCASAILVGLTRADAEQPSARQAQLLGDSGLERGVARVDAGVGEAFPFVSSATGTATSIHVYIGRHGTARALMAGLYADAGGRPGRRVASGSVRPPRRGAWNVIHVRPVSISAPRAYWLAILSKRGPTFFRVRVHGPCDSARTAIRRLASLPTTWGRARAQRTCPISAYVTGSLLRPPSKVTAPPVPPPSSPPALPPGVTLQQIDGGMNYFGAWSDSFSTSPRFFPIGVFNQTLGYNPSTGTYDPSQITAYKNQGFNTFINLYNGYNQRLISAIHAHGMGVLAGPLAPSYANGTIRGYVWFDEADGENRCSDVPSSMVLGETVPCDTSAGRTPTTAIAQVNADLKGAHGAGDATRPDYCQYTKPVAELSGLTEPAAAAYVNAGCNIVSYDSYIINDGWATNHDLWRQYDDVRTVRREAEDNLPVWPFIEAGDPMTSCCWSHIAATPAMEVAEAWNAIIAGARGIEWFDHDFNTSDGAYTVSQDVLIDPGEHNSTYGGAIQAAVKQFNFEVQGLAPVLNSPFAGGYVSAAGGPINVMAKYDFAGNEFYIFAAPRSDASQTVTFTVAGGYSGPVTVYGENRMVTATHGRFADTFRNQTAVHIYVVPN